MDDLLELKDKEFVQFSQLIYNNFGIYLSEKKKSLVRGRLNKLLKGAGYSCFQDYYDDVVADKSGKKLLQLIDKISTNHTYFYRESDHFDYFRNKALPEMFQRKMLKNFDSLRIWCAGCATGEEAYTLSMILDKEFNSKEKPYGPTILATDISLTALEQAESGTYSEDKIGVQDKKDLLKYFTKKDNNEYQVKEFLKEYVLYKKLNLKSEVYPFKNKFHFVFCRNVMIYFDKETKDVLVNKIANVINPNGFLFIGHSESLGREPVGFRYICPAVYQRI